MTHARTLPRYVGIAGLVAGLLAPVSSLAAPAAEIRGVQAVGATASSITTEVSAAYRFSSNDPKYYHQLRVAASRQTLRQGALAALTAGRLLPGLGIAITAAGFIYSNTEGQHEILKEGQAFDYGSVDMEESNTYIEGQYWSSDYTNKKYPTPLAYAMDHLNPYAIDEIYISSSSGQCGSATFAFYSSESRYNSGRLSTAGCRCSYGESSESEHQPQSGMVPITSEDTALLDEHLPGSIVDDFWSQDPAAMPEPWADAISVLPFGNIDAAGQASPEAHQAVSRWAENMTAKLNGEELPHPETDAQGNTAPEQQLEEWDEPPPESAYPAMPEPEWNVEIIDDLPSYDAGLGGGTCPEPNAIDIPLYGAITLDWQPACDLASNIRGAVIGICFIAALYIVLGQSRSSES